ncbi:MAG: hypothetical protein H6744_19445, partial [Deltaproteobacteria bacterium]|nr:hypothetical protein [Deltaproteobacteria bacterium]
PVTLADAAPPGEREVTLVALEAEPSPRRGASPADLERLDRADHIVAAPGTPVTRAGLPLARLSALALQVAILVPDHTHPRPRPPRPPIRHRGDPRHERYWEVPPQRDTTWLSPPRASRYRHVAASVIGTAP